MSNTNGQMTRKLPGGTPQMSRNQKRMFDYNVKKYNAAPIPANWSDDRDGPTRKLSNKGKSIRHWERALELRGTIEKNKLEKPMGLSENGTRTDISRSTREPNRS